MRFVLLVVMAVLGATMSGKDGAADPSDCPKMLAGDASYVERCAYSHIRRALTRYERQQYDLALENCNQAIQLMPEHFFSYFLRGSIRLELGDPDGAIADYDRAIGLEPTSDEAYFNRGQAYATRARFLKCESSGDSPLD